MLQGHVDIELGTLDIPAGTTYPLGLVAMSQAATTNQPAVDLSGLRDLVVEGTLTVPAGGFTNHNPIELRGLLARITGADPLALTGPLSGEGSVQVSLAVLAGGSISVGTGQELTFTQPVSNVAGTTINDIGGTLTFPGDGNGLTDDGLVNSGSLNLINAVVNGDVRSPSRLDDQRRRQRHVQRPVQWRGQLLRHAESRHLQRRLFTGRQSGGSELWRKRKPSVPATR